MTINLLTGKKYDRSFTDSAPGSIVEGQWTAEAYLASMRRLLNEAGRPGNHTASYIAAAGVLAEAAKTAPAELGNALPCDGDTVR